MGWRYENSNPNEIPDIELIPINIPSSGAVEQKNFNNYNQTSLISYMGRVGCSSNVGIIQ